jgi:hypothetical protein
MTPLDESFYLVAQGAKGIEKLIHLLLFFLIVYFLKLLLP